MNLYMPSPVTRCSTMQAAYKAWQSSRKYSERPPLLSDSTLPASAIFISLASPNPIIHPDPARAQHLFEHYSQPSIKEIELRPPRLKLSRSHSFLLFSQS